MERRSRLGGRAGARRAWLAAALCWGCASGAGPAVAGDSPVFDPLAAVTAALGKPVEIRAVIEPGENGTPDVLAITAAIEDGWHVYSLTQKAGVGPRATVIEVAGDSPRRPSGPFAPDAEPSRHEASEGGGVVEEHEHAVTWRAPLEPGVGEVRGSVTLQACQKNSCTPPDTITFTAAALAGMEEAAAHRPDKSPVALRASFGSPAGRAARLMIEVVPDPGWHVYRPAATATGGKAGQGLPTIVTPTRGSARVLRASISAAKAPASAELVAANAVEGAVRLELLVEPDAAADVIVGMHACSDERCLPPLAVRVTARQGAPVEYAVATYAEAAAGPVAWEETEPVAAAIGPDPAQGVEPLVESAPRAVRPAQGEVNSLVSALVFGLLGGLILNLMPCVLPVLGLKLMSFAQQSGQARGEVFRTNLWYCAGVYAVFLALASVAVAVNVGLGGGRFGWGTQFQYLPFQITMLGIVFAFALSLLGVWEIPIPGFVGEQAGRVHTREGALGSFLKGVLGTLLATPCSGPFLGPVLLFTAKQPAAVTYVVFGAIATGMALPYILVGLFPGFVKFMPKPGAWMATFKELLGFVMLGTVAFLFYTLDRGWFIAVFVTLIGIWMGCWWVGRLQERQGAVGFGRWVQGAAIATAVGFGALLLLKPHGTPVAGADVNRPLIEWQQPFSAARLAELRAGGSTVLVDCTADWCLTCKWNLAWVIETHEVAELIRRNGVVPILADYSRPNDEIAGFLQSMDSVSIPFLVIFPGTKPGEPPRAPIVLRDLIRKKDLLEALEEAGPSCCPPPTIRAASTAAAVSGR